MNVHDFKCFMRGWLCHKSDSQEIKELRKAVDELQGDVGFGSYPVDKPQNSDARAIVAVHGPEN